MRKLYNYNGPVYRFDKEVGNVDITTIANSESQAINNIKYQIRKKLGLIPSAVIDINTEYLTIPNQQKQLSLKEPEEEQAVQLSMFESYTKQGLSFEEATKQAVELAKKNPGTTFCYGWQIDGRHKKEFFTPFAVDDNQRDTIAKTTSRQWMYTYDE